jgi:hypothetical protein
MDKFHLQHAVSPAARADVKGRLERWPTLGMARILAGVLVFIALLGPTEAGGQVSGNKARTTAKQISSVSKKLGVPTQNGAIQKLLVEIADWSFSGDETEFDLPAGVSAIMTVVNGRVSITSGGVPKEYSTGDYWTAPAGAHMAIAIEVPARSAIVRTIIAVPTN